MRTTTRSPAAAAARTLARVLKAVLSLLILAAAVAGLPLLLAWATPVIWAATHDDLTHLLDRQDTGSVFLLLLACVGWIGWAQFSFCAVREVVAQLRGRTWSAPRGMGASQRAAALLVGSILVLLPTSSALASDAHAAPVSTAGPVPGQAVQASPTNAATSAAGQASPTSSARTPTSRTYTVRETRPAESLWGIAERELGDGERWRVIASLNEGRTMPDGQVFRANSFLQPGWQLQMPATAGTVGGVRTQLDQSAPAASEKSSHVVTVHSGDYLSKIAERELGDGKKWPELFEASKGKPQPDGLPTITDPDMIHPGQQVTVPGAPSNRPPRDRDPGQDSGSQQTTPPAPQSPEGRQNPSEGTGDAPDAGQSTAPPPTPAAPSATSSRPAEQPGQAQGSPSAAPSATPQPTTSASSGASSSVSAEPSSSAASSPAATATETPASTPSDRSLNLRTVLGAGALLAAAVTGALALRRTLQRRRRTPGEKIAIAAETSPAEAQLAAAAEPGGAARLDVALRTLAHRLTQRQDDAVPPPVRAARIGARTVQVLPEDLTLEAVAPFVAGKAGWWVLPSDADLLDEDAARDVPAPSPGLVTIGHTAGDDLLLLNLARLPALLLDGNPVHITEVCTSLALELAMSPWASDIEVVTIGFGEELPHLLPTTRIAHMRHATHALRDLSERLLEAHQWPEISHQPYLVLCAAALDTDTAQKFADIIDKAGTVPVTLVAPASTAAAHFPTAEILNASIRDPQPLDATGTDIIVQRLEHTSYLQITTALRVSTQAAHPPEGPWQDVPEEPNTWQEPTSQEFAGPAPDASPTTSPASGADIDGDVFPALLAATTDPSGPRLPPATTPTPHAEKEPAPGTDAPVAPTAEGPQDQNAADEHPSEAGGAPETDACDTHDLHAPEIRVLGPVEVDGVGSTGHGPRMAQLAALLFFRPGRTADVLCCDMDPVSPWTTSTLNARMQGLRSSLGSDSFGNPYVPRRKTGEDPYRLAAAVRCDWTHFLRLVERALPLGPAGLTDLEKALALVRGRPFGGKPLPWAEPIQQEIVTRIIDVAHTVATHRTPAGPHHDLNAARQAIATGLEVDDTAELLYRDWMRLEAARGNRAGLHTAITRIQHVNAALDCSLETHTTQLIHDLLTSTPRGEEHSR